MSQPTINRERLVTVDMLQHLPEPAQRYMTYTGVVGQPWIDMVHLKYTGRFRLGADKSWMPMAAEQFYTTNPPGFLWKAHFKLAGLPLIYGHDTYKNCHGHMFGKLAGLITLFDAQGDQMDQGTMLRYLQEMTWFPIAMLGDNITWQAVDDQSADITFHDCDRSVTGRMSFDSEGRLTNFVAQRYRENKGQYSLDTWAAPVTGYGMRAGLNLPISGYGAWKLPAGDLRYIELEVSEITYNGPIEAF